MTTCLETRIIVVPPCSAITPGQLLIQASSFGEPVELKETCYGLIVQGEKDAVARILKRLRTEHPFSIFSKVRGFRIGEKSRCRSGRDSTLSGGPRPGFHQMELERRQLTLVSTALESMERSDMDPGRVEEEPLDEKRLMKLIREIVMECPR
jgi:putative methanogenesis marker protein 6